MYSLNAHRIFDLTSHVQKGGHDVMLHRRHFTQKSSATRRVDMQRLPGCMQQRAPVSDP